jgi:hypothetical protein
MAAQRQNPAYRSAKGKPRSGGVFLWIREAALGQARVLRGPVRRRRVAYDWPVLELPDDLPGHELVGAGVDDLAAGRESEAALLVAMAASRLRSVGVDVPQGGGERPAHRLYELLTASDVEGAHSRYNALLARLVSFARAAEHASPS